MQSFFVCLGAQRAGTTGLRRHLSEHPNLYHSPSKKLHFFDQLGENGLLVRSKAIMDLARRLFPRNGAEDGALRDRPSAEIEDLQWALHVPVTGLDRHGRLLGKSSACAGGETISAYGITPRDGFLALQAFRPDARIIYLMRNPVARAWSYCKRIATTKAGRC